MLAGRAWAEMGITAQNRSALSFSSTVSASCRNTKKSCGTRKRCLCKKGYQIVLPFCCLFCHWYWLEKYLREKQSFWQPFSRCSFFLHFKAKAKITKSYVFAIAFKIWLFHTTLTIKSCTSNVLIRGFRNSCQFWEFWKKILEAARIFEFSVQISKSASATPYFSHQA